MIKYIITLMLCLSFSAYADDVTQVVSKLSMSKAEYEKTYLFKHNFPNSSFSDISNELTYTYNRYAGCDWKLVHDGKKVITVQHNCGTITSIFNIVVKKTKADIIKEIETLNLTVSEDVQDDIDNEN